MYNLIKTSLTQLAAQVKITAATKTNAVASKRSAASLRVTGAQAISVNIPKLTVASSGLPFSSKLLNGSMFSSLLYKVATIALTILVVSCAAGGGGGSISGSGPGGITPVSAFSHNSYAFASGFADSDSVPGIDDLNYTPSVVGTVFPNDNQIKSLAAALIGTTDPQEIADLTEGTDYTIAFSLVADADRPDVAQYFSVDETSGAITVTNPYGVDSDLTFGDIRGLLNDNSIDVKVTITVTNPEDSEKATTDNTVTITILDNSAAPQLGATGANAEFIYDIASISSESTTETVEGIARDESFIGELTGSRIESGSPLGINGSFEFSTLLRAATFVATTDAPTGGVLAAPGNAFLATDIYSATHITQELTVNVNVSLNSNGSMTDTVAIVFPTDTAFSLVDANASTAGSFLNQLDALVTTVDLLNLTAGTDGALALNLTSWNVAYSFTREFTPDATTREIPGKPTFTVTGDVAENNLLAAQLTFGTPKNAAVKSSNPITSFSIQRVAADATAPQVTLFYGLRKLDNTALCGDGAIYLDNNDLTVKANAIFDFEGLAEKTYQCRLAVSSTGSAYSPFALVLNDGTAAGSAAPVGINVTDFTGVAQVAQSGAGKQVACSVTNPCYYADLNITITDGNDAPVVSLVGSSPITAFAGSVEGKGVLPAYNNATKYGFTTFGANSELNTTTGPDSVQINVVDLDAAQTGTDASNVRIAVVPDHGSAAFSTRQSTDREVYDLVVNRALLDYEAFTKEELTEAGAAIYKITITAADNTTATLTDSATFNFEVKDVKFTPVFVNPQDATPLEPASAFVKESNILAGPDGSPLYLSSGLSALNRIQLGSFAAVDPETNLGTGLSYNIFRDPNPANLGPIINNLALRPINDGAGQNLLISNVNLINGTTETITLLVSSDSSFRNPAAISRVDVAFEVNDYAYLPAPGATTGLLDAIAANADIKFNRQIPLVAMLDERGVQQDDPFPITFLGPIPSVVAAITNTGAGTPNFGIIDATLAGVISSVVNPADLESLMLNLSSGSDKFAIDATTGIVTLNANTTFNFPSVVTLPIYVNTGGPFNPAALNVTDITIVTIIATDVNSPPEALNLIDVSISTLIEQINEKLPAGTPVTTFTIRDDNQAFVNGIPSVVFAGQNADTAADLLRLTTQGTTVTITSNKEFDASDPSHLTTLADITLNITDSGVYTQFNPVTQQPLPLPIALPALPASNPAGFVPNTGITTQVALNIELQNVVEPPALEVGEGTYSIAENAAADAEVTSSAASNVIARITNTADFFDEGTSTFNASKVVLTVTGHFAEILEARYIDSDPGAISLNVIDTDAADTLENLGDGRTFTATIVATPSVVTTAAGLAPVSGSVKVRIRNIPANSQIDQTIIDALIADAGITINEQDVAGESGAYSIPTGKFNIPANSLVKDADEIIGTGANERPIVSPTLALGSVTLDGNLDPQLEETNILTLTLEDSNYRLSINDADFVENALFDSVNFILNVSTPRNTAGVLASDTDSITFTQATDKSVAYENAARDDLNAPATPPVYALRYTQTEYAGEVTNISSIPADATVTVINSSTSFNFSPTASASVPAGFVNITASALVYPTVDLGVGNFIARSISLTEGFSGSNADLTNDAGKSIIINVNSATNLAAGVDILSTDAAGNLVDARAEFDTYFNLAVNNTDGERSIQVTQKVIENELADSTVVSYNALDTIQLYAGSQRDHTLNYFIRARAATDGTSNASNYALAQFSVAVSAAGLRDVDVTTQFIEQTVTEGFSGEISALILELTDSELLTGIVDGTDISSNYSITFSPDFLTTMTISKQTLAVTDEDSVTTDVDGIRVSGVVSRELMDADVNMHTVRWTLSDATSSQVLETGNFILNVGRLEDPAANGVITFTDTEAANPIINYNAVNENAKTFPIRFSYEDPDFLETPVRTLQSTTFNDVTLAIAQTSNINCMISTSGGVALFANNIIDNAVYTRTAPGSVSVAGDLAAGANSLNLDAIKAACSDIEIGAQITSATFTGVSVENDGANAASDLVRMTGGVDGTIISTFDNPYTIQGFRTQAPTITSGNSNGLNTHAFSVSPDASASITLTITDTDSDDGTPLAPTNSNAIRDNANTQWASELAGVTNTCSSSQIVDDDGVTVSAYTSTGNAAEANVDITVTSKAGATGSCVITVPGAGEDGENFPTQTITVNFQIVPTLTVTPPTAGQLSGYVPFSLEGTIVSGDIDLAPITVSLAFDQEVCTISPNSITILSADAGTIGPLGSITVTPIKPGDCAIRVTAEEQGAVSDANTPPSVFPEVAPTFVATSSTAAGQRANAASEVFSLILDAGNKDIGDDEANNVAFTVTSDSGLCTAELTSNTGTYGSSVLGATATATVTIRPTTTTVGGVCQAIVVTATEDGQESPAVTIPTNTFIFDSAPTLEAPVETTGFTNYATPIVYTVALTSADGNTASALVSAVSTTTSICTAAVDTMTTIDSTTATITITPVKPGDCSILLTAEEDGVPTTASVDIPTFTLPELAPTAVSNVGVDNMNVDTFEEYRDGVTITTEVTDNDHGDAGVSNGRPVVIYSTNDNAICTVNPGSDVRSFNSPQETATTEVSLKDAGQDCVVTITTSEASGADSDVDTITITQAQVVPTVRATVTATQTVQGTSVNITVTATKQDAGASTAIFAAPAVVSGAGCIIEIVDPFVGPTGAVVSSTYKQIYSVTTPNIDRCELTVADFTVTEEDSTVAAATYSGGNTISIDFVSAITIPEITLANPIPAVDASIGATATFTVNVEQRSVTNNPTVAITAVSTDTDVCTIAAVTTSTSYSNKIAASTYTATYASGREIGLGGTCPVLVTADESAQDEDSTFPTVITFNPVPVQVGFETDASRSSNTINNPLTGNANTPIIIVSTATKMDNVANGRTAFFLAPVLTSSDPVGACRVTRTGSITSDFPDNSIVGATRIRSNDFEVVEAFRHRDVTCAWTLDARSNELVGSNNPQTVYLSFAATTQLAPTFTITPDSISDIFPDDGVQDFTVRVTKKDEVNGGTTSGLVTIATGDSCSSNEISGGSYGGDNADIDTTISATFSISAIGAAPTPCTLTFTVNDGVAGTTTGSPTRTITYNPELSPTVVPTVVGDLSTTESSKSVSVVITSADDSSSKVLTVPTSVSNGVCTANRETKVPPSSLVGRAPVTVAYTVTPDQPLAAGTTDNVNCGALDFTATEGRAAFSSSSLSGIVFEPIPNQAPTLSVALGTAGSLYVSDNAPTPFTVSVTKQDAVPDPTLAISFVPTSACLVTDLSGTTITGSDEISGSDISTYRTSGSLSKTYQLRPSGAGACSVTATATEDNIDSDTASTTPISFIAEVAPTITAVPSATGEITSSSVNVVVTATKQDGGSDRSVTFSRTTASNCGIVVLAGTPSASYPGGVNTDVAITYRVTPITPPTVGNPVTCGTFNFNARESSTRVASTPVAGITFAASPEVEPTVTLNAPASTLTVPADQLAIVGVTITKQDNTGGNLAVTASSIDGNCDARVDSTSTYSSSASGATATSIVSVDYARASIGLNKVCSVTITVDEDGAQTTFSQSVNFNAVKQQVVIATIADRTVAADQTVVITATASKQDMTSDNTVVFTNSVSGPGCMISPASNTGTQSTFVGSSINSVASSPAYSITLNSNSHATGGSCIFAITADVDGSNSSLVPVTESATITFNALPQQAPTLTISQSPSGNSYPDDPAVTYTMTITSQDQLAGSTLTTSTIARESGTCTVNPVQDASYNGGFTGTEIVSVKYNGGNPTSTGSCTLSFTATEDGRLSSATRTLTFNPEAAPAVTTSVTGSATPTVGADTTFDVVAMKNDSGAHLSIDFPSPVTAGDCSAAIRGPSSKSFPSSSSSASVTATYDVTATGAGACAFAISGIRAGSVTAATATVSGITFEEPVGGTLTFGDVAMGVTSGVAQRTATIEVTTAAATDTVLASFSNSGCVVTPATSTGAISHTFTVTQKGGSVGSSNCVDVGVHTKSSVATGGSILIQVSNNGGSPLGNKVYADNSITFAAAGVELALAADDYNIVSSNVGVLPAGAEASHIYNFLDARRWYFANDGDDNLKSYAIYRGVNGNSALATQVADGLGYFFSGSGLMSDTGSGAVDPIPSSNAAVARAFFVNPSAVPSSVLTTPQTTLTITRSILATNGYDASFFSNLTNYAVDGYLRFTTLDVPRSTSDANLPNSGGAFIRGLATSTTSNKPLVGIATATGSAINGFALKARMCRIAATGSATRMQRAALNAKALSCDTVAAGELLTDTQAAKIMSLGSGWNVEAGGPIVKDTVTTGVCENIGRRTWQSSGGTAQSFCGGADATGGDLDIPYTGTTTSPIRWSFQQYFGTRSGGAPASMFESGIYLAEVYPVPTGNTDLSVLLGKPVRVLFEVFTQ